MTRYGGRITLALIRTSFLFVLIEFIVVAY
jgi:hypothetical protein